MFQFTRNNQTFKCVPMLVEGFNGDINEDSGFVCTNTKPSLENFENTIPSGVSDQVQKLVVTSAIKNYDQCVQNQTINSLANANKLAGDDGAVNNTRYAMCAPFYNNPGWTGGSNQADDRKDAFKYPLVRFVRLDGGSDYINLSQLVVTDEKGVNIAKGKSASSSGSCCDGPESKAVDGVEAPRGHPGEYHSSGGNAFFEIDLGNPVQVYNVVIYNRADCCQNRMGSGYKIRLLDAARNEVFTSKNLTGDMVQTVVVKPPVFAKLNCPADNVQAGNFCYPASFVNK